MFLAIVLFGLLSAAAARMEPGPAIDAGTTSDLGMCLVAGDSQGSSDSDQQWRAQHYTIAAVTESIWKSALVHADLATTRLPRDFEIAPAPTSPDPPVRSTPHYLRHTPLLI